MIKSVSITNHLSDSIRIPLDDLGESGFIITNIDGLGPVKANINFTELATNDGAIDNSARLESRNIVMSMKFTPNPTIEDARLLSYKFFPIKQMITFEIETDNRMCITTGRVETNEPIIFDESEGCQISIMCPDPYFYAIDENGKKKTEFYGLEPLFEFPFENASLNLPTLEFGQVVQQTEGIVLYEGDADVGVTVTIHATGECQGLKIFNVSTRETIAISDTKFRALVGSGIQAGDVITVCTIRGKKGITLLRGGQTTNILNALEKPIGWFRLTKGENLFAYSADYGLINIQFSIESQVVYEGV